jgi:hypothetical protein
MLSTLQRNVRVTIYIQISNSALFTATVLSRVQAFLPTLQASNALLVQRAQADPKSVDIEHIDEGMEQYIEMVCSLLSLSWSQTLTLGISGSWIGCL